MKMMMTGVDVSSYYLPVSLYDRHSLPFFLMRDLRLRDMSSKLYEDTQGRLETEFEF